jgi:hypothetical protein
MTLAIAAVIGFYIYGKSAMRWRTRRHVHRPGIGGMFLLIGALFHRRQKKKQNLGRRGVTKPSRRKPAAMTPGNNDSTIHYYTEYAVIGGTSGAKPSDDR